MRARSTAELRLVCTRDAADYTQDAIEAARSEPARRGQDVSALAPAARPEPPKAGLFALFALALVPLVIGMYVYRNELPFWLRFGFWSAMGAGYLYLRALAWRRGRSVLLGGDADSPKR